MTAYSKKTTYKQRLPLLISGAVVIVIIVWFGFLSGTDNNANTDTGTAEFTSRQQYDDLFQLFWRVTDRSGNVSMEATLFTPDVRAALMAIDSPSDHQLAMQRELEGMPDNETAFYLVIAQPNPFLADPDISNSKATVDGVEIDLDWSPLDPLWLDQQSYFQRDGFLSGQIDINALSIILNVNYPENLTHNFIW